VLTSERTVSKVPLSTSITVVHPVFAHSNHRAICARHHSRHSLLEAGDPDAARTRVMTSTTQWRSRSGGKSPLSSQLTEESTPRPSVSR
jgi:hypothetical protein